MWILIVIVIFVLIGLWDHFFGPKQPPKPKFRAWSPEINKLNENLYRDREANDYQRGVQICWISMCITSTRSRMAARMLCPIS